ncbi:hypothetical protein [Silvibacterium acidisoli]|uniref:hypothetical protein n=1 Tax=Acidobacteriaceae bacterium ZG23-2 TaxID=2883246 RepID=UPI00406BE576
MPILKKPIFLNLDRRREVIFDLNTEKRIQSQRKLGVSLWEEVGEYVDAETGEIKKKLNLNLENFGIYLWAALYDDAHKHGELLTVAEVGALVDKKKKFEAAYDALSSALLVYYGDDEDEPGEDIAHA